MVFESTVLNRKLIGKMLVFMKKRSWCDISFWEWNLQRSLGNPATEHLVVAFNFYVCNSHVPNFFILPVVFIIKQNQRNITATLIFSKIRQLSYKNRKSCKFGYAVRYHSARNEHWIEEYRKSLLHFVAAVRFFLRKLRDKEIIENFIIFFVHSHLNFCKLLVSW